MQYFHFSILPNTNPKNCVHIKYKHIFEITFKNSKFFTSVALEKLQNYTGKTIVQIPQGPKTVRKHIKQ